MDYKWSDGRWHTFVIGANNAVWSIFIFADGRTSGWYSLGGQAKDGVFRNHATSENNLGIAVTGLDDLPWCLNLVGGNWQPWHHCQHCGLAC